jgi:hypothetical protein
MRAGRRREPDRPRGAPFIGDVHGKGRWIFSSPPRRWTKLVAWGAILAGLVCVLLGLAAGEPLADPVTLACAGIAGVAGTLRLLLAIRS